MPSPATTDDFLDLVQKSAVVDDKRLIAYVEKLRANGSWPSDPKQASALLVRDGVLTNFQAEQMLQGKWKRFTIGKYKILERLGAGGMGSVYLCEHKLMRRRVAVKVLPTAKADDPSSLERFYREARAVAALDHPNIVRAYDIDQEDKLHFLVMEHVDGASLQEIIKKHGPMDVLRACHYMRQAALGLQHAHDAAGLVHRDIKPGNVLVDRNGIVKILDMGLARFFYDEEDILTKKYDENVLGTADYLAPEQATDSHAVDIRADIYSLGATFYYCLTGRTPFQEGTVAQKLIWHQTRLPKPIRSFRAEVPEGVVAVIDKAMSKDANARYQSPLELAEALSEWTRTPIPPPPESEMPKLSLAALGGPSENSFASATRPVADSLSPTPRKTWQVPPSPSPLPKQAAAPPAPPSPVVRATPPKPAKNGLFRQPAASPASAAVATPPVASVTRERPKSGEIPTAPAAPPAARPKAAPGVLDLLTKRPWLVFAAVALMVLALIAAAVGLAAYTFASKPAPAAAGDSSRPTRTWTGVNAPGDPGFEDFIKRAKMNERIILQEDVAADEVHIDDTKNLTIEAAAGKTITWRYSDKGRVGGTMLVVNGGDGVTVKGIAFDGDRRARTLINLYGPSAGLKLKDLQLTNFKQYGVLVINCEGSSERRVSLTGLRFTTTDKEQVGLYFETKLPTKTFNRCFLINDCTFAGPGVFGKTAPGSEVKDMDVQADLPALRGK
jgi:serine/threonine protein kinase